MRKGVSAYRTDPPKVQTGTFICERQGMKAASGACFCIYGGVCCLSLRWAGPRSVKFCLSYFILDFVSGMFVYVNIDTLILFVIMCSVSTLSLSCFGVVVSTCQVIGI